MRVDWSRQTIMKEVFFTEHARTEVKRLHHATRCHDTKKCVEVWLVRNMSGFQGCCEGLSAIHVDMESLSMAEEKVFTDSFHLSTVKSKRITLANYNRIKWTTHAESTDCEKSINPSEGIVIFIFFLWHVTTLVPWVNMGRACITQRGTQASVTSVLAEAENTIILFVCPPKFGISIISCFSWDLQWSQEKTKTKLIQNLGGQTKNIMVFSASANCWLFPTRGKQTIRSHGTQKSSDLSLNGTILTCAKNTTIKDQCPRKCDIARIMN